MYLSEKKKKNHHFYIVYGDLKYNFTAATNFWELPQPVSANKRNTDKIQCHD